MFNTQKIMATYYYQFDRTSSNFNFTTTTTIPDSGYDISEFNGDSRGTPRVADWSDFSSFNTAQFDALVQVFGFGSSYAASVGYLSWDGDPNRTNGNKYYRDLSSNRAYFLGLSWVNDYNLGEHETNLVTSSPLRRLDVGSWRGEKPVLVYFPNYQANGGHSSLIINGSTSVTWDSTNKRFSSSGGSTTLSHNGTTWVINDNGTTSNASLNSSNIGSHVDPASSDLNWQNGFSVSTPSVGAQGDPHINPILGKRYTI